MLIEVPWCAQQLRSIQSTQKQTARPPPPEQEFILQLLEAVPTLLLRIGFAEQYRGWRTSTWGWVAKAFPSQPTGGSGTCDAEAPASVSSSSDSKGLDKASSSTTTEGAAC